MKAKTINDTFHINLNLWRLNKAQDHGAYGHYVSVFLVRQEYSARGTQRCKFNKDCHLLMMRCNNEEGGGTLEVNIGTLDMRVGLMDSSTHAKFELYSTSEMCFLQWANVMKSSWFWIVVLVSIFILKFQPLCPVFVLFPSTVISCPALISFTRSMLTFPPLCIYCKSLCPPLSLPVCCYLMCLSPGVSCVFSLFICGFALLFSGFCPFWI